jgi:hypothetical protein
LGVDGRIGNDVETRGQCGCRSDTAQKEQWKKPTHCTESPSRFQRKEHLHLARDIVIKHEDGGTLRGAAAAAQQQQQQQQFTTDMIPKRSTQIALARSAEGRRKRGRTRRRKRRRKRTRTRRRKRRRTRTRTRRRKRRRKRGKGWLVPSGSVGHPACRLHTENEFTNSVPPLNVTTR